MLQNVSYEICRLLQSHTCFKMFPMKYVAFYLLSTLLKNVS